MNIGERLGDYEIIGILGAGGMGQVYKVRNVLSDRIEAMKVLLPNMSGDPELADRFLREIKVQAALDHPNIARLYTAQQYGNQLLMFMEFIDGTSVEKLLREESLSLDASLLCASQVLDALSYAHGRGVVHRDVKPGNIIWTAVGIAKLMDFGIARMRADRRLTQTGRTVGSLYYMSPEQINGAEPDPRSDLYSFGVMLYEMVTGRKPFQGDSDYSIMAAHLHLAPPPPIELAPGVPSPLNDLILMAIAKDPQVRFQSADAFRKALSNVAQIGTVAPAAAATPPPPPAMAQPENAASAAAVSEPPRAGGRRALYMTLGSVATVAVLAAAVWQAPKFLHVHAGGSASTTTQGASTADATPPPASDAASAPPPSPATDVSSPSPAATPAPAPIATATPANSPPAARPAVSKPAVPPRRTAPVQAPVASAQPAEAPAQMRQPIETPPTSQPQPAPAAPAQSPAAPSELRDLRKQYNDLSVRAAAAKAGLRSIQQQMRSEGLNLRTDILEVENRMDYLMKEAWDAIQSGDLDEARSDLQMAEISLSTIQKFLGH